MLDTTEKQRDSRLRSMAERQGFALRRSRAAVSLDNYGHYMIVNPYTTGIVAGPRFDLDADDVERFLTDR